MGKMLEKMKEIILGKDLELREQLFRMILSMAMLVASVAIVAGVLLDNSVLNAVPLAILMLIVYAISRLAFKYHKIDAAAIAFGVLIVCGLFPLMFFLSGGIESGAAVWFVLGIMYIFIIYRGYTLGVFLLIAILADAVTYIVAYQRPDLIIPLGSKSEVYYDSLFAILVVGIAVGMVMRFQLKLYEQERNLSLKQKEEIEQISRSRDAFFMNMSHEIRTPINTIIGLNEMILRENISDEVAEDAIHVKNASKMLLTIINDVLDFSQIENKRMSIVPVPYRIVGLIDDVVDLVQMRAKEKDLELYVDIDSSLPSVLLGDEVRVKQVLTNLMTNAVKYTQKGSVTLSVRGGASEGETEQLTFSVSDTGIGIKKEDIETLYDSFQRLDLEKNRRVEGSGLGLAITKQLVSLMGGKLTVDSIYTKGSVFTVILDQPIVDKTPVGSVSYERKLARSRSNHYKQSFEAPLAKVLVVDDNDTNLMVVEKLLRATKVSLDKAKSGTECLEMLEKKAYHVVLLDSLMPEMDGLETLREIRRRESKKSWKTPVIVLTADTSGEQRYLDGGFDGYLAKPIEGSRLEAEVLKFLPEEVLEYQIGQEEAGERKEKEQGVLRRRHKKIQISTDCASDLSKKYLDRYDIKMMYQFVRTDEGVFRDTLEIDTYNLSRYLSRPGNTAVAFSASVEEYEAFYAEGLTEAEDLVHISLAGKVGKSYQNACAAAKCFGRVHVIDAGHISCGAGLLVLIACNLLANGCSNVDELCGELDRVKKRIETSFIMPSIRNFYAGGYTNKVANVFFSKLGLYPILKTTQSRLKITGIEGGKLENAKRRYIRRMLLRKKARIDQRVAIITHAGCTVRQQKEFVDEVLSCIPFQKVILEKASVSCSSNGGIGTMGIAYLLKEDGKEYMGRA